MTSPSAAKPNGNVENGIKSDTSSTTPSPSPPSPSPSPSSSSSRDPAAVLLRRLSLSAAGRADARGLTLVEYPMVEDDVASAHPPSPSPPQPPLPSGAVARRVARAVAARRKIAASWLARVLDESAKLGTPILLPHVVCDALAAVEAEEEEGEKEQGEADPAMRELLAVCAEAVVCGSCVGLALRPAIGVWVHVKLCSSTLRVDELSISGYLRMKECAVGESLPRREELLGLVEVDLAPFAHGLPRVSRAKAIGDGLRHLNRHLTSKVLSVAAAARSSIAVQDGGGGTSDGDGGGGGLARRRSPGSSSPCSSAAAPASPLVDFLRDLEIDGLRIMLGDRSPADEDALASLLARAEAFLATQDPDAPAGLGSPLAASLRRMGFEPGWGATAGRALEMMEQLSEILDAPAADVVESFLARIPLVTKVVSVSVHGYFAQSNALGKPDSGGQIVYVLDAVRALEKELNQRLEAALGPPPGGDPSAGAGAVPGQPPRHPRAKVLILTRLIPEALDTSCDARLERVAGTEAAAILRVPFRAVATASPESGGSGGSAKALRKFVSRFQVCPFLEDFALDSFGEILRELGGSSPDLILGNYSDGNLVATLLSRRFSDGGGASGGGDGGPSQPSRRRRRRHGPTQCSIAHALEPNKYRDSQARWNSRDYAGFNFETMFTSDLISATRADFIVTSTQNEIGGKEETAGQYEAALSAFTLPGLYRVVSGIDVFDPRFNIVSPACDSGVYYSFSGEKERLTSLQPGLKRLLYGGDESDDDEGGDESESGRARAGGGKSNSSSTRSCRGRISGGRRHLPVLFSMARLDSVKNLVGLARMFAGSARLRAACNLFIVGGDVEQGRGRGAGGGSGGEDGNERRRRRRRRDDDEEEDESVRLAREMHALFDSGELARGEARWVSMQSNPVSNGELYRVVADTRGSFVLFSTFENFGLTCVEAMSSGLPTIASQWGGPSELIKHGINGFHIDPYHPEEAAETIADFFEKASAAAAAKTRSHADGEADGGGGGSDAPEDAIDDPWLRISRAGLQRIASRYTWPIYACRLATLTSVYAFWKRSGRSRLLSSPEKGAYLDLLTKLVLRPLIARVPRARDSDSNADGDGEEEEEEEEEEEDEAEEDDGEGRGRNRGGGGCRRENEGEEAATEDGGGGREQEAAGGFALGVMALESMGHGGRGK